MDTDNEKEHAKGNKRCDDARRGVHELLDWNPLLQPDILCTEAIEFNPSYASVARARTRTLANMRARTRAQGYARSNHTHRAGALALARLLFLRHRPSAAGRARDLARRLGRRARLVARMSS